MGSLFVDHVPDELIRALEARARRNGRSPDLEHRAILAETLGPQGDMRTIAAVWRRRLRSPTDDDVKAIAGALRRLRATEK